MDSVKVSRRFKETRDEDRSRRDEDRSRRDEDRSRRDEDRSRRDSDRKSREQSERKRDRSRDRKRKRSRSRDREDKDRKHRRTNGDSYRNGENDQDRAEDTTKHHELVAEELRQKQILYQAKRQLQEKIQSKGFNLSDSFKSASALNPQEAAIFANSSLTNLGDMQKNLASTISQMKEKLKTMKKPEPVKQEASSSSTVDVKIEDTGDEKTRPLFDYAAEPSTGSRRRRKAFHFVEKGTYERQAKKERNLAQLSKLQNVISTGARNTGISSAVRLAIVTPASAEVVDDLPDIEWWDHVLLKDANSYDGIPSPNVPINERYAGIVTNLIEHPVQLKPPNAGLDKVCIKTHLTKKEMKRLRRMNRREAQREEQEKIRLGLIPTPEPKIRMANLMRVLGTEAIQDPTKMEAFARKQEADRLKKHLDANAERKLTKEQKSEKKARKIMEDTSVVVHVAVYKVLSLANPSKRFKVLVNAKQLQMTGIVVSVEDMHVVVVEGGPKQQRQYKKLMLKRIKWNEELVGQKKGVASEEDEGQRNECSLIWEGTIPKREFNTEPKIQVASDHRAAREIFSRHNVPHYWDHCFSHSVLLSSSTNKE